jgi:hypothetical protein
MTDPLSSYDWQFARTAFEKRRTHWILFWLPALALVGSLSCAGAPTHGQAWERPWECNQGDVEVYKCGEISVQNHQPTWNEWEDLHKSDSTIAYECTTLYFDPEYDPDDFICKPFFSRNVVKYDDGTAPRFHCFGTNNDDEDYASFHCDPYWELKLGVRKARGTGWFLWLSLQSNGEEARQFRAVADRFEQQSVEQLEALLKQYNKSRPADATPTMNASMIKNILKQGENMLKEEKAREKQLASRSLQEIQAEISNDLLKWQSDQLPVSSNTR